MAMSLKMLLKRENGPHRNETKELKGYGYFSILMAFIIEFLSPFI